MNDLIHQLTLVKEKKMKNNNEARAIVTIIGKDRVGILAAAAVEIAKMGANVITVSQNVNSSLFTMMMEIDIENMTGSCDDLSKNISSRLKDMKVSVMNSEIFNSMHTI